MLRLPHFSALGRATKAPGEIRRPYQVVPSWQGSLAQAAAKADGDAPWKRQRTGPGPEVRDRAGWDQSASGPPGPPGPDFRDRERRDRDGRGRAEEAPKSELHGFQGLSIYLSIYLYIYIHMYRCICIGIIVVRVDQR